MINDSGTKMKNKSTILTQDLKNQTDQNTEEPTITDQDAVQSLKEEMTPIIVPVDSVSQSNDNISISQKSIHLDPERIKIENSFDETE